MEDAYADALSNDPKRSKIPLETQMKNLTLAGQIRLPLRPAYGRTGQPIVVWANYFPLEVPGTLSLNRYKLEFPDSVVEPKESAETDKPETEGQSKTAPTGKKLERVFNILIQDHLAAHKDKIRSDFKQYLYCPDHFFDANIQSDVKVFPLQYRDEHEDPSKPGRVKTYTVKVFRDRNLYTGPLFNFLKHVGMGDPDKEDTINALNIAVGHFAKTQPGLLSIGANKHFQFGPNAEAGALNSYLTALRGFLISVRPATGRLLVNLQVKNTAIYTPHNMAKFAQQFIVAGQLYAHDLHRVVRKKVRVVATHFGGDLSKQKPKVLQGVADPKDGTGENRPKVARLGAGPSEVQFFLTTSEPAAQSAPSVPGAEHSGPKKQSRRKKGPGSEPVSGRYVTVAQYFKESMCLFVLGVCKATIAN